MFARGEPVFFSGLEHFTRLPNELELIIAKGALERPGQPMHLRGRGRRARDVRGHDQPAPDVLPGARTRPDAAEKQTANEEGEKTTAHDYFAAYSAGKDFNPSTQSTVTRSCFVWKIETVACGLTFGSTRALRIWVKYCD